MKITQKSMTCVLCAALICLSSGVLSWSAPAQNNTIPAETVGRVRVQALSPTLVRLEVKGRRGFEDRVTFHIADRDDWPGDTIHRSEANGSVALACTNFTVNIPKRAKSLKDVTITGEDGNVLWAYTGLSGNKIALPAFDEPVPAFAIADTPRVVPAAWGFSPQPESNKKHRKTNGWDTKNDAPDMYIFLPGNDHVQLRADFVRLTGRTEMLPLAALGAWDSRYYAYTQETAMAQLEGYHGRGLPLNVLVIDTDWRVAEGGTGYGVNTELFPDMQGFIDWAHGKHIEVMFNDHPEPTRRVFNKKENHVLAPKEVEFRSSNLQDLLRLGLDAWWYDRNWWTTVQPLPGFTHEVLGMALYADAQRAVYPDRRLFMMSNVDGVANGRDEGPGSVAAHRYAVQWTGDTGGHQETILQELRNALLRGETGPLPYVSTDLGTHTTHIDAMSGAEYLRWMQFGALSPVFRPHCTKDAEGRMPWLKGDAVTDVFRDYVNLRYRLLPVFYALSRENYDTGLPMLRPMALAYPDCPEDRRYDQYLLGEDILIAPVLAESSVQGIPAEWFSNLKGEYFNNTDLSGGPVLAREESGIDFDWDWGSPDPLVNDNYFSARFTGTLTPAEPVSLHLESDDGCRLTIDGDLIVDSWKPQVAEFSPDLVLEAGRSYDLRLEFFEEENGAKCVLRYIPSEPSEKSLPRTVWIPEGAWIDTVAGETVTGPQTIEIGPLDIDEYPIFIRGGAVLPLADEMLTTKDADWSHLTLDVYPCADQTGETTLYEDDTISNAYQKGEFRTTLLRTVFADGKAALYIGKAEGTFTGPLAFMQRDWTIRVHRPEDFGPLEGVTRNGEPVPFEVIAKVEKAMPLALSGGATDGDVYVIQISAPVEQEMKLSFTFR